MIKALFFDIDGTLVSFKSHEIPDSTIEAIKKAKENGIKIFISTGRPKAFITSLNSIEKYIDGFITNNGACAVMGDEIICSHPISDRDLNILMSYAKVNNKPTIVMGKNIFGIYNYQEIVNTIFYGELRIRVDLNMQPIEKVLQDDVYQVTMFINPNDEILLMKDASSCNSGRWCDDFTDITDSKADKGQGLIQVAKRLGINVEETMAFGDGGNDIPIIKTAGIGVAMGNAKDDVKYHADYVTSSVDNDGIFNALKHFEVI